MRAGEAQGQEQRGSALAKFILARKSQILARWEAAARRLPTARELSEPALRDSVPELLEAMARLMVERASGEVPAQLVEKHTFQRLDAGFDLGQVVAEYSLLRDAILELWECEAAAVSERGSARVLHRAIDQSISLSVARFTEAQIRAARALDRIATASLESHDLDDLLRRLLLVLIETVPAIHTATVLLRTGDVLRVRAAVGIEREVELGFSVRVGEGFEGTIAAQRRPMFLKSAASDPLVTSQVLRDRGVRALYGVPLIDGGSVLGVAHVGSLTAYDFSDEDRRMVDSLASRATAAIYQQMLRRDAEQRAAELRAVIDAIPDAVYIADRQRITTTNRRGMELLGFDAPGQISLQHGDILKRLHARDTTTGQPIGEHEGGFARAFRGEASARELMIVRPDGQARIIRSAVAPIESGGRIDLAVAVTTDITDARRYEQERADLLERERAARTRAESAEAGQRFLSEATAILASSLEYERTLERVTSLAVPQLADWCSADLVGADGKLRTVSLAHADPAKRHLAEQLAKQYPIRSDSPFGAPEVTRTGRAQVSGEISDDMLVRIAGNEEQLGILRQLGLTSYVVVPIKAHGGVFGALSLASGRESGRRYGPAELEIAEHLGRRAGLAIDNARLYREAQEAVRLREQVLAVVSHDLRNPLMAVKLATDIVTGRAREHDDARLAKQADTIRRSTARMNHLIGDLLDMASMRVGSFKVERHAHCAGALVQEAIEPYDPIASEQGIRLATELDLASLQVQCDRERILQVFSNLLGNAFKFCGRGDQITVRAGRAGDDIRFEVADTGPGIPVEERQHIFDPFWSTARHGKTGTGLGLFITRGLLEAHGGRIWVDSEPGRGSTFAFTLPLSGEPAAAAP